FIIACLFFISKLVLLIFPSCVVPKNCCHLLIVAFPLYPSTYTLLTTLFSPPLLLIYLIGSTAILFLFLTSKCKCEPVTFPVAPCRPIIVFVVTFLPFLNWILFIYDLTFL